MGRSCASVQNFFRAVDLYPQHRSNLQALESMTLMARLRNSRMVPSFPRLIPVVVHVLSSQAADDVSDEIIRSQIDVLNEDFNAANADIDAVPDPFRDVIGNPRLTFELAKVAPDGSPTTGIVRKQSSVLSFAPDDRMKADATGGADPWDTSRYLNMWVCQLESGLLGYAQFPGGNPKTDGVVITTSAFGRHRSPSTPFNLGRTCTHEVGHYLNLFHIWGNAIIPHCDDSDDVPDTPNQLEPNNGKPLFPTLSCNNAPHGDMFMNFMDYVDDDTMVMFTRGQVARMHAALEFSRAQLGDLPVLTS